jgi:hypothetical protein
MALMSAGMSVLSLNFLFGLLAGPNGTHVVFNLLLNVHFVLAGGYVISHCLLASACVTFLVRPSSDLTAP